MHLGMREETYAVEFRGCMDMAAAAVAAAASEAFKSKA